MYAKIGYTQRLSSIIWAFLYVNLTEDLYAWHYTIIENMYVINTNYVLFSLIIMLQ